MYCFECGNKVNDGENFCAKCGTNLKARRAKETTTIRLKCQECGGTMSIDRNKDIMSCPYCGSQRLIMESDDVKIERMHTDVEHNKVNSYTRIELEKQRAEQELRMREMANKERKERWKRYAIIVWAGSIVFFLLLAGIGYLLGADDFTAGCFLIIECVVVGGFVYLVFKSDSKDND